ncbi:hypothetical protein ACIGO8_08195 [Streptomyces sp. NPDC053493]|uniref:hypothetical protein n=1 Tax=Streptomyces sp. NPDC053493 TaxID=3365705 RepID=UPI0037D5EEFC
MTDLTQALESRFGPAADWPLKIRTAQAQLETLQRYMGDDYTTYVRCARQAVDEHRAQAGVRTTLDRRERFGLLLHDVESTRGQESETIDVAWATNFGLEILLNNEQYEQLIDAAVEANEPAVAGAR